MLYICKMIKLLFYAFCVTLFVACSPQKRLNRIIRNHPELIKSDTIYKQDTTVVNGVAHDTIFKTQITKDTVTIVDKQLTIKYYNDGKTTYLKGKCDTVWVVKEIPVVVNKVVADISKPKRWYEKIWDNVVNWLAILGIIAVVFIVLDLIASKMK